MRSLPICLFVLVICGALKTDAQELGSYDYTRKTVDSLERQYKIKFEKGAINVLADIYSSTHANAVYIEKLSSLNVSISGADYVRQGLLNYLYVFRLGNPKTTRFSKKDAMRFKAQTEMVDLVRRAPRFGFITIYSVPDGAHVYIDNRDEERLTPVENLSYITGNHFLLLRAGSHYEDYNDNVTIFEKETTKVMITLQKKER